MAGKKARAKARKLAEPAINSGTLNSTSSSQPATFAPAEMKLERSTQPIKAGTVIFKEEPLIVFKTTSDMITELMVKRAYASLSPFGKVVFDQCRHDPSHKKDCSCKLGTFEANIFTSGDMFNSPQSSMFPVSSRINHSCEPNSGSVIPLDHNATYHSFMAFRDIAAGEEITFSYRNNFTYLTNEERRKALKSDRAIACFRCCCKLCVAQPRKRLSSDMRRRILRHLHIWLRQDDVDGALNELDTPPRDPKLVENGVYSLLYAILHEVEGVVHGNDAYMAHALTAWHVLNVE